MKQIQRLLVIPLLLLVGFNFNCDTTGPVEEIIDTSSGEANTTGTLRGEVQPIEGVLIQVRLRKGEQLVAQIEAQESYEINAVEAGNYTLQIAAEGYKTKEMEVTVIAGEVVSLDKVTLIASETPAPQEPVVDPTPPPEPEPLPPGQGLSIGSQAPAFELPDGNGKLHALADYTANKNVVLIFYRGGW